LVQNEPPLSQMTGLLNFYYVIAKNFILYMNVLMNHSSTEG
jgi:hypothetical protein